MTTSLLDDAMSHHIWATETLIDVCRDLPSESLATPAPGSYGSILETLRHLVGSDCFFLTFFRDGPPRIDDDAELGLDALRSVITANGRDWMDLLARGVDGEAETVEQGDGWTFHAPTGLRLAQVVHHGTDHRSQVCTALSSLGVEPPVIDLWAYGEATGRTRPERA
jgi:uncharacterized damage-inducible protein DinB